MADEEAPTTDAPAEVTAGRGDAGLGTAVATQAPTPLLEAAHDAHREAMRTRVIIPLVLPLITAAAILVYVLNLSRALLAGGKWGALAIASIVTVTILSVPRSSRRARACEPRRS